jgi:exosome complex component CSL4
MTEDS